MAGTIPAYTTLVTPLLPTRPPDDPGDLTILGDPRYSEAVLHGASIMECFLGMHGPVLGNADIAEALGMSRSTTHRYVATLSALGWLEQGPTHKYRLAARSASPGIAILQTIMLASGSEPVLHELRKETGYTVSLGALAGNRAVYARRLFGHRKGQYQADGDLRAGAYVPLHCTAVGKALLASLPEEELRELLAGMQLTHHAPRTINAKKRLREQVKQVRREGIAVSDREFVGHECAVAVAVAGLCGVHRLAVEVTAPAAMSDLAQLKADTGPLVLVAARSISDRDTQAQARGGEPDAGT